MGSLYQSVVYTNLTDSFHPNFAIKSWDDLAENLISGKMHMVTHSYTRNLLYSINTSDPATGPLWYKIKKSFELNPLVGAKDIPDALKKVADRSDLVLP